jgi:ABC-type branched-subunit amino acid transport system ATPase component
MPEKGKVLAEVKDLCKNFGVTIALSHVDFAVKTGEIRGLIGENGSGKSTVSSSSRACSPQAAARCSIRTSLGGPKMCLRRRRPASA